MRRESFKVASGGVLNTACYYLCGFKTEFDDSSYVVTCLYTYPNSKTLTPKKKNYFIRGKERGGGEFTQQVSEESLYNKNSQNQHTKADTAGGEGE